MQSLQSYGGVNLQNLDIFVNIFLRFLTKTTPYRKIFRSYILKVFTASPTDVVVFKCRKICLTGWEIGEIARYLRHRKKNNKISAASQTVATAWNSPKICRNQPPALDS